MNIYEDKDDGVLDIAAAVVELKRSGSITSEGGRRHTLAEINAAALLDIAGSLRVIAAEAKAAMPVAESDDPDAELDDPNRDFLVEGDLVAVAGLDDPAEVLSFGVSEGALYAIVRLTDGSEARAWLDTLTRLVGDERDDDTMQDASEGEPVEIVSAARVAEMAGATVESEPMREDLVDDIDDDFEGDESEAASALDLLKSNEAARKGKKKGSKK